MIGHDALLHLRLNGIRPSAVFVYVLDREPMRGPYDAESAIGNGGFPEIEIGASEVPGLLDLRCLRDTRVHVVGEDEPRVRSVARRAVEFSPSQVIACSADGPIIWNRK